MKYTPEERMDIGRRIYERELTCRTAAEAYGIHKHTAKRYLWMYRDAKGLPPKTGRPEGLKIASAAASALSGDITEYENMSREELIRELVLSIGASISIVNGSYPLRCLPPYAQHRSSPKKDPHSKSGPWTNSSST